jgi:RND superfamily putative drug exporter
MNPHILPPRPQISTPPPHPAAGAQPHNPAPEPAPDPAEPRPTQHAEDGQPEDDRSSIERWMADLRSSRRHPEIPADEGNDEGRHSGNSGRTVSVNELLRRQDGS